MNAISIEVSISAIAAFSGDGRVFRAFGHLLAAKPGELLAVPLGRTSGDLRAVVDLCPVPWAEFLALIDAPADAPQLVDAEAMCRELPSLARLTPYGWVADRMPVFHAGQPEARRWSHVSGMRFARSA